MCHVVMVKIIAIRGRIISSRIVLIMCFKLRSIKRSSICTTARNKLRRGIYKRLFFLLLFAACGCNFYWGLIVQESPSLVIDYNLIESPDFKPPFTIFTEGCKIPAMSLVGDTIKEYLTSPNPERCDDPSANLLGHNNTHIWTRKEKVRHYHKIMCCYRAFVRPLYSLVSSGSVDDKIHSVHYHPCVKFSDHITIEDEFVRITCYASFAFKTYDIHDQFFLFARKRDFVVQKDIKELKNDNSSYNVLVMGMDSVSRLNLYRTMPKTIRYLKNNGAVDFLGYNKVGENTKPNLIPMLLGVSKDELARICVPHKNTTFDKCPFVWNRFKQAGYYTALVEDTAIMGTFTYNAGGFAGTPTDYFLDSFIYETEKLMNTRKKRYCSNDVYLFQILLDYIDGLTTELHSSKLFGFSWEGTLSHNNLNDIAIMDDSYVEFFKKLESKKYLAKTVLIFVSDHGVRVGKIAHTKQGWLESRLPFMFILAPPSFRSKYSEAFNNLKINRKRLVTTYNVHAMLNDLANLDNINDKKILSRSKEEYWSKRSISLFLPIPGNRTCQAAGISDHFCTCRMDVPISMDSELVKDGTEYLIGYLNQMLAEHEYCAKLTIDKLMEAREVVVGNAEEIKVWRVLSLVVRTKPGYGEFEATLRRHDYDSVYWAVAGEVSRLNLFGNQSYCVNDNLIKVYCYCV